MRSDRPPAYCHACGSRLSPGAAYCSNCGTQVDRRGTDRRSPRFRERIADLQANGWDVIEDTGDRVILADRSIGSIPIHILLLLFTSGIGNLLYAWYAYDIAPPKIEVHADGTERYIDGHDPDDASGALTVLIGLFVGFILVSMLVSLAFVGSPGVFAVGTILVLLAVLGLAYGHTSGAEEDASTVRWLGKLTGRVGRGVDRFLAARESVGTFGRKRTVSEAATESYTARCTACGEPVLDGVERTFADRLYVAGLPIRTYDVGTNEYCPECAHGESYTTNTVQRELSIDRERLR